jgi:hypothetical protein
MIGFLQIDIHLQNVRRFNAMLDICIGQDFLRECGYTCKCITNKTQISSFKVSNTCTTPKLLLAGKNRSAKWRHEPPLDFCEFKLVESSTKHYPLATKNITNLELVQLSS